MLYRVVDKKTGTIIAPEKAVDVKITKAQATAEVTANKLTYNGTDQTLVSGTTDFGRIAYAVTSTTETTAPASGPAWSLNVPKRTGAGQYRVWYTVDGTTQYDGVAPAAYVDVTIDKATVTVTPPETKGTITYTGSEQFLCSEFGKITGLIGSDTAVLKYAVTNADAEQPDDSAFEADHIDGRTEPGKYWVWYKVDGLSKNYNAVEADHVEASIVKDQIVFTPPTGKTDLRYTGQLQTLVEDGEVTEGFDVIYNYYGNVWNDNPQGQGVGDYIVTYKIVNADWSDVNWSLYEVVDKEGKAIDKSGTVKATISPAIPEVTAPVANELTYNGEWQVLTTPATATVGGKEVPVVYARTGIDETPTGWSKDNELVSAIGAGTYRVWYKVNPSDTCIGTEPAYVDVTVAQKPVTLFWDTTGAKVLEDGTLVYEYKEGTEQGPGAWIGPSEGLEEKDEIIFDRTWAEVKPGKYNAAVSNEMLQEKSTNYKFADDAVLSKNFIIERTDLGFDVSDVKMTYGDLRTPTPTVKAEDKDVDAVLQKLYDKGNVQFFYRKEGSASEDDWTAWGPNWRTPAGTYEIKAVATDPEGLYEFNEASGTLTINKKTVTVSARNQWIEYGEVYEYQKHTEYGTDFVASGFVGPDAWRASEAVTISAMAVKGAKKDGQDGKYGEAWDQNTDPGYELVPYEPTLTDEFKNNYEIEVSSGRLFVTPQSENDVELVIRDYTYGDQAKKPAATAEYGVPTIYYVPMEDFDPAYEEVNWVEWTDTTHPELAGEYVIMAEVKPSAQDNYPEGVAFDELTVAQRPVTIKVTGPKDKAYDGAEVALSEFSATVDNPAKFPYYGNEPKYKIVCDEDTIKDAGDYIVYADFDENSAVNKNYSIDVDWMLYTITKRDTLKATAEDVSVYYDGDRYGIEVNVEGLLPADKGSEVIYYSYEPMNNKAEAKEKGRTDLKDLSLKDVGRKRIYFFVTADNYKPAKGSAMVEVKQATLQVSLKEGLNTTYGDLYVFGEKDVDFKVLERGVSTYDTSEVEGALDFYTDGYDAADSDAGEYRVEPYGFGNESKNKNYKIKYVAGKFTVNKKSVGLIWQDEYGESITKDFAGYEYDGNLHGVYAIVNPDQVVGNDKVRPATYDKNFMADAGNYTASVVSLEGRGHENYAIDQSQNAQVWTINQRSVWVEWPEETQFDFDGTEKAVLAELVNTVEDDDVTVKYADDSEHQEMHADSYTAIVTGLEGDDAGNYILVENKGSETPVSEDNPSVQDWKIRRCPVTLTWPTPDVFLYDGTEHTYGAEISPKTEIDKVTLAVEYADDSVNAATNEGEYTASVIGLDVTDIKHGRHINEDDYKLVGADGTPLDEKEYTHGWQIVSADLMITADNKTKVYGDSDPELTYTVTKGTIYDYDDITVTLTREEGEDAGTYVITPTVTGADNYDVVLVNGTLTITPAALTVTADDKTVNYGDAAPALTYKVSGKVVKGDKIDVSCSTTYFKNAAAGTYPITVKVGSNPNYTVKAVNGKVKVNAVENTLVAKAKAKGSKKAKLSWNAITGAASYDIYFAKCNAKGKKYTAKYIATVSGTSFTKKKLKKGTCYKFYVVAKRANGSVISTSEVAHFAAGNVHGKRTNAKSLTINASSLSLIKGNRFHIVASQTKAKKGKKLLNNSHAALLRYRTSNGAVATVNAAGVITAVGSGYCKVYVQTVNGIWQAIEVNVK